MDENDSIFLYLEDLSLETLKAIRKDLDPVSKFKAYEHIVWTLDGAISRKENP
jgi:hypothetical protein